MLNIVIVLLCRRSIHSITNCSTQKGRVAQREKFSNGNENIEMDNWGKKRKALSTISIYCPGFVHSSIIWPDRFVLIFYWDQRWESSCCGIEALLSNLNTRSWINPTHKCCYWIKELNVFGVCELGGLTLYLTGKAWAHRESDDGIERELSNSATSGRDSGQWSQVKKVTKECLWHLGPLSRCALESSLFAAQLFSAKGSVLQQSWRHHFRCFFANAQWTWCRGNWWWGNCS